MDTIIDRFGRIVIPKRVRNDYDLKPGTHIRIVESDDAIVLKPLHGEPNVIKKDGVLVFTGTLVGNTEKFIEQHRRERMAALGGYHEDSI